MSVAAAATPTGIPAPGQVVTADAGASPPPSLTQFDHSPHPSPASSEPQGPNASALEAGAQLANTSSSRNTSPSASTSRDSNSSHSRRSSTGLKSQFSSSSLRGPQGRPSSIQAAKPVADQLQQPLAASVAPFRVGVVEERNKRWRRTMEDAHSFVYDFGGVHGQGFYGIFDGHAGLPSAEWCGKFLYRVFRDHLVKLKDEPVPGVFNATFQSVDKALADLAHNTRTQSGCTAVTCFLRLEDANGVPLALPGSGGILSGDRGAQGQAFIGGSSVPSHIHGHSTVAVTRPDADPSESAAPVSDLEQSHHDKNYHQHHGLLHGIAQGLSHWHHPHLHNHQNQNALQKASSVNVASAQGSSFPESSSSKLLDPLALGKPFRRVLYTANVGDARAVLCRRGKAVRLTYDHKGSDPQEASRVQDAGGFVMNNRVNGVLAVTRSLGDNSMKQFVVGKPYTTETTLGEDDTFLIVACDGLWDVTTDQQAVDLISDLEDAQEAAQALLDHAMHNFSTDNTSIMVIHFNAKPQTGFASSILS